MRQGSQPLDRSILAAFKQAHDVGRLDVAEHLLCALECLCGDDAVEESAAGEAYRVICCRCEKPENKHECRKGRKQ